MAGDQVGRPEPSRQRRVTALHDGPGHQAYVFAARAATQNARTRLETERLANDAASWAGDPSLPAGVFEIGGTGRVVRRAVRGKSGIGEAELVWGAEGFGSAWVDWRWALDGGDVATLEEAADDEVREALDRQGDTMSAGGDAQQRIGDHRGEELEADGIVVVAEELADLQMLLDPTEQELDLPAAFVEGGDLGGRAHEVVCEKRDRVAAVTLHDQPPQPERQLGISLAGKAHLGIFGDDEAVASRSLQATPAKRFEPHVGFRPRHEERAFCMKGAPPAVMAIALVEDIGRARLDRDGAADLRVVDVGIGDVEDARAIGPRIVDDVHLHPANAAVRLGPVAQLAERDRGGVDQPHHGRTFAAHLPEELAGHQGEGLGEDGHGAAPARIRHRRAPQPRAAEMIVVLAVGVPARFQAAKARRAAELGEDQDHQVIPAAERLVIGIPQRSTIAWKRRRSMDSISLPKMLGTKRMPRSLF